MALTQKQKDIKDKKVESLNGIISVKTEQRVKNLAQAQEVADKLQSEIDEAELIKQALESLK